MLRNPDLDDVVHLDFETNKCDEMLCLGFPSSRLSTDQISLFLFINISRGFKVMKLHKLSWKMSIDSNFYVVLRGQELCPDLIQHAEVEEMKDPAKEAEKGGQGGGRRPGQWCPGSQVQTVFQQRVIN